MSDTWTYFLMRNNLTDTGQVPGPGPASSCPDIIPWGTQDPPPGGAQYFIDNYGKYYDFELVIGQPNRVYLRSKNLAATEQNGQMKIYWSKGAFLLWPTGPNGWTNNIISTASNKDFIEVTAPSNGMVASSDPFLWTPQPIYGDHYCLIGGVSDATHPIPPANVDTIEDLADYVLNNRNVGWHNTRTTTTGTPSWSETSPLSGRKGGGKGRINLSCKNCPIGWKVSFEFYTPDADGKLCKLPWTPIDNSTEFARTVDINIPDNYETTVFYGVQFNGIQPTQKWQVTLDLSYLKPASQDSARRFSIQRTCRVPVDAAQIPVYDEIVIGGRGVEPPQTP